MGFFVEGYDVKREGRHRAALCRLPGMSHDAGRDGRPGVRVLESHHADSVTPVVRQDGLLFDKRGVCGTECRDCGIGGRRAGRPGAGRRVERHVGRSGQRLRVPLAQRVGAGRAGDGPASRIGHSARSRSTFKRRFARTGIVVVVPHLDPAMMLDAMRAGVNEVVPEPVSGADLRAAVERVTRPAGAGKRARQSTGIRRRQGRRRHDDAGRQRGRRARGRARHQCAHGRSARDRVTAMPRCSWAWSRASPWWTRSRTCIGWTARSCVPGRPRQGGHGRARVAGPSRAAAG